MPVNKRCSKRQPFCTVLLLALSLAAALVFLPYTATATDTMPDVQQRLSGAISSIVADEMTAGHIHGAVIVAGIDGHIAFRGAFGDRMISPHREPMTLDTIFDLASLTKVVATTTAIMQLQEQGRLELDQPISRYWPEFAQNGKAAITIADLLTHYSGLPPDLPTPPSYKDYATALQEIAGLALAHSDTPQFSYSDIDFVVLGEIVRRVSGLSLDRYCARHIFPQMEMRSTTFQITGQLRPQTAPADVEAGELIWGQVQDPMARQMGGVAGHAGLFSTASDLTHFAQMLLNGGIYHDRRILSASSVRAMTHPQSPPGQAALRGYGWDIDSPYSGLFSPSLSPASYGHTGYTGTALWIDPASHSFLLILTNRLHPDGSGSARMLEQRLAAAMGEATAGLGRRQGVMTGIDTLEAYDFRPLLGHRVALLSHAAGRDMVGRRTVDVLAGAKGITLVRLLSPEHGFASMSEQKIGLETDVRTGLPIYSLYGDTLRPSEAMLQGVDAIVIDLQDAGVRYYTYATTMAYVMEAAAEHGIDVYVLDRPNPIGGAVQGPVLDADQTSFTGYWPIPVRHGMTIGELAAMFNEEAGIHAKLHVVPMRYYRREMAFDQTGLTWVPPSPNLPTAHAALLYAATGLVEGANVSVGRGTQTPFELVGAPWVDEHMLVAALAARHVPGVVVQPAIFTPTKDTYARELCHGVRIGITDRKKADLPELGMEIIAALYKLYPDRFDLAATVKLIGSQETFLSIENQVAPDKIAVDWREALATFEAERQKYLIYPMGD